VYILDLIDMGAAAAVQMGALLAPVLQDDSIAVVVHDAGKVSWSEAYM
jgi:hypothetical protein